ncbi:MAG: 1-acyl-sn-glycerol-3-phosphate acyltransferase [Deltaproteobacteria bacterium]|jgi:1-acyl-sn-glycerol-3-phosphate acyltransferase|nr:1-acyl-sn-glycerol-3-phosphate acyltransferase [Deltaproteobacteria bacterium]
MLRFIYGLWYLPIFFCLTIISGVACLIISLFSRRLTRFITGQIWANVVLLPAFIKVEVVSGRENLPDPKAGGFIVFANHRSLLDIPVAAKATGRNFSWVAKAALGRIPIFGWTLMRAHMLVERGGSAESAKKMLDEATQRLSRGEIMAIFPEGTRNKTSEPLLPFKKGAFILAKHTGVPLIPLAIQNSGQLWPSGSYLPKPGLIRVAIGRPIKAEGSSLSALAASAHAAMGELYVRLTNSPDAPTSEAQSSGAQSSDAQSQDSP